MRLSPNGNGNSLLNCHNLGSIPRRRATIKHFFLPLEFKEEKSVKSPITRIVFNKGVDKKLLNPVNNVEKIADMQNKTKDIEIAEILIGL